MPRSLPLSLAVDLARISWIEFAGLEDLLPLQVLLLLLLLLLLVVLVVLVLVLLLLLLLVLVLPRAPGPQKEVLNAFATSHPALQGVKGTSAGKKTAFPSVVSSSAAESADVFDPPARASLC